MRFPVGIRAIDPEGKLPTVYSWSLGVQHEPPWQLALDVAYVGNVARHLYVQRDLNQLPLGTTTNTNILQTVNNTPNAIRPFKGYTSVTYVEFGASSNYHSLQTRVSRRFGSSLTFNVNYTWSKAIDENDGDTDTIGYYLNRLRDRAVAGYDRTHVLTIDYIYLAAGFQPAAGRQRLRARDRRRLAGFRRDPRLERAAPLGHLQRQPGDTAAGARANYLGGEIILDDKPSRQVSQPARLRPAAGWRTRGNTGRNFLRGPGFTNFDFSVFKDFRFTERVRLQYRAEFFNIFNHTQWFGVNTGISAANPGDPVTAATRGTSGQFTSTRDPRNIQMALKLLF